MLYASITVLFFLVIILKDFLNEYRCPECKTFFQWYEVLKRIGNRSIKERWCKECRHHQTHRDATATWA
ncbi:MAG: hypothetical protein NTZ97_00090 [Candidatus Moranbacteria bacterium]|nr:hypothetical protein [Candidatus Moranbacteria bacterium]